MNASERIREALLKSEAARKSGQLHTTATTESPDATQSSAHAADDPIVRESAEVESTLPLLGSSDQEKIERARPQSGSGVVAAGRKSKTLYIIAGVVLVAAAAAAFMLRDRWSSQPQSKPFTAQAQVAAQPNPEPASTASPATETPAVEHSQVSTPTGESAAKVTARVEAAPPPKPVETPQPTRVEARQFTPPPVKQQKVENGQEIMLDPSSTAIPGGSPIQTGMGLPQMANHAPVPLPKPAPAPLRVGGKVAPPVLVKKVSAVYPVIAKNAHVEGLLRFTATIGKDGKVRDLQLVSGPRLLVQAATEAIRQWVYRPSLLNGEAVDVSTQIELQFSISH